MKNNRNEDYKKIYFAMLNAVNADYRKMYLTMFNAVTDAIQLMEQHNYGLATATLRAAQAECEEIYMDK